MLLHDNDYLLKLLQDMDVPINRIRDVQWLLRNLSIRNSQHKNYAAAMKILKLEAKRGS